MDPAGRAWPHSAAGCGAARGTLVFTHRGSEFPRGSSLLRAVSDLRTGPSEGFPAVSEVFRGGNRWLATVTDPFSAGSDSLLAENSEFSRVNSLLLRELSHFHP